MAMLPLGAALFFGWPADPLPASGTQRDVLSTMVFAAIVLMQMANAFECRSTPASLFSIGPLSNRLLVAAVAVEALTLLAFVYVPPISNALAIRQSPGAIAKTPDRACRGNGSHGFPQDVIDGPSGTRSYGPRLRSPPSLW
jgi:magnesium-transporting ATPase (P-type)